MTEEAECNYSRRGGLGMFRVSDFGQGIRGARRGGWGACGSACESGTWVNELGCDCWFCAGV